VSVGGTGRASYAGGGSVRAGQVQYEQAVAREQGRVASLQTQQATKPSEPISFSPGFTFKDSSGRYVNLGQAFNEFNVQAQSGRMTQEEYNARLNYLKQQAKKSENLTQAMSGKTMEQRLFPEKIVGYDSTGNITTPITTQGIPTNKLNFTPTPQTIPTLKLSSNNTTPTLKVGEQKAPIDVILGTNFFNQETLTDTKTGEQYIASKNNPNYFYKSGDLKSNLFKVTGQNIEQVKGLELSQAKKSEAQATAITLGASVMSISPVNPLAKATPGLIEKFFGEKLISEKIIPFEERTITGTKSFIVEGEGVRVLQTTSKFREILGLPTKIKSEFFNYSFDVAQTFDKSKFTKITPLVSGVSDAELFNIAKKANISVGKVPDFLKGSPQTIEGLLSEDTLTSLYLSKSETQGALRGVQRFESGGFIDFYKKPGIKDILFKGKTPGELFVSERKLVGDVASVYGKGTPVVRVAPLVRSGTEVQPQTFIKTGFKSFGEESLSGSSTALLYNNEFGSFTQLVKTKDGLVEIIGNVAKGKERSVFDLPNFKAFTKGKLKDFGKETPKVVGTTLEVTTLGTTESSALPILAESTKFVSPIGKTITDVYGFQNFAKATSARFSGYDNVLSYGVASGVKLSSLGIPSSVSGVSEIGLVNTGFKLDSGINLKESVFVSSNVKSSEDLKLKEIFKNTDVVKVIDNLKSNEDLKFNESFKEVTIFKTPQAFKQVELLKQPAAYKQVNYFKEVPFYPKPVVVPKLVFPPRPPLLKKKKSSFGSGVSSSSSLEKAFSLFGKKKGKEVLLGRGLTLGEALSKGKSFAFSGAQRTIALKQEGFTQARRSPMVSLEAFRTPTTKSRLNKLGEIVLVQKSKYAISTAAEKREIPGRAAELRRIKRFGF